MPSAAGFRHEALFYRGVDDLLAQAAPFLAEGAAAGEPMLVVLPRAKNDALRDALGAAADAVTFADMDELGRNPAHIIPAWRWFVDAHADSGRSLRGIGEPIGPHRSGAVLDECHRHEALLNVAFADAPSFQLVCPYDRDALDPDVAEHARRTHPVVRGEDGNDDYDVIDAREPFATPLATAPVDATVLTFDTESLAAARRVVREHSERAGLSETRVTDLVLATNEMASNSIEWGGGGGRLAVWRDESGMVCEVTDAGLIDDPLIGRRVPARDTVRGRGHWIANQVCDLVQVHSSQSGTAVRLHVHDRTR